MLFYNRPIPRRLRRLFDANRSYLRGAGLGDTWATFKNNMRSIQESGDFR